MRIPSEKLYSLIVRIAQKKGKSPEEIFKRIGIPIAFYNLYLFEHNIFPNQCNNMPESVSVEDRVSLIMQLLRDQKEELDEFTSEIRNACDKMVSRLMSPKEEETFFVWLDILGFKNKVKNNTKQQLEKIVDEFVTAFDDAFDESRTYPYDILKKTDEGWKKDGIGRDKIGLSYDFNFRLFSDSIIIWTNSSEHRVIVSLLSALSHIMRAGFISKNPLRGVLTFGDSFSFHNARKIFLNNEAIYGKALVSAYELEESMNWSGCLVTPVAWTAIKKKWDSKMILRVSEKVPSGPEYLFTNKGYLTWYPIPMQKEYTTYPKQNGIVINWCEGIDRCIIQDAFSQSTNKKVIEKKMNTLLFFDKMHNVQESCLPTPPADYLFLGTKKQMKTDFLLSLFLLLNDGYSYAVLRNWEGLPGECSSRDIDILITKQELRRLKPELSRIASETGCGVLYENWDNQFWTVVYADEDANVFQLDFQYNFAWMGIDLLDDEEVLKAHRVFNGTLWHTDAMFEFMPKYLYCCILGGKYPPKYADVRERAMSASGEEIEATLQRLSLGKGGLEYWDNAGKWSLRLRAFFSRFFRNPFRTSWRMWCFVWIYIWQLFTRRGWMISFSGPDGCGKSTVIDLVCEKLSVNPPRLYHFRPTLFPNLGDVGHKAGIKKEVDHNFDVPHRAKRCGKINSLVRLAYYMSDYIIGYWVKIMPLRQRKFIVFFDRYFTDIMVDSERSSIFLPYKLLCWLRHFVPSCQKNFFIRVKPETILARKQELTMEDMQVIYERLEYLATRDKRCVWIDNNGTAEEAARQIIVALRKNIKA